MNDETTEDHMGRWPTSQTRKSYQQEQTIYLCLYADENDNEEEAEDEETRATSEKIKKSVNGKSVLHFMRLMTRNSRRARKQRQSNDVKYIFVEYSSDTETGGTGNTHSVNRIHKKKKRYGKTRNCYILYLNRFFNARYVYIKSNLNVYIVNVVG